VGGQGRRWGVAVCMYKGSAHTGRWRATTEEHKVAILGECASSVPRMPVRYLTHGHDALQAPLREAQPMQLSRLVDEVGSAPRLLCCAALCDEGG